jgi:Flp pilus assembly protein TadG
LKRDERGAMAIEVVILTPALVVAIMLIATGARYVDARGQTNHAAYAAARAASLTTNQEAAVQAGTKAAQNSMAERGQACAHLSVGIDAGQFTPGGSVRATVTCTADLSDLVGFGLPGSKTFSFTAVVPLEEHRSIP